MLAKRDIAALRQELSEYKAKDPKQCKTMDERLIKFEQLEAHPLVMQQQDWPLHWNEVDCLYSYPFPFPVTSLTWMCSAIGPLWPPRRSAGSSLSFNMTQMMSWSVRHCSWCWHLCALQRPQVELPVRHMAMILGSLCSRSQQYLFTLTRG